MKLSYPSPKQRMNDFCLADYEPLEKIGEGGICDIWKIRRRCDNVVLAFKKLKSHSPENIQAIKDEYQFLKFHGHPGIIGVYEYIYNDMAIGLVMDILPGETLEVECGKLEIPKLKSRFLEILEIANFVTHCGYVYNDYKPQNFLIDDNGKLKLIDFNLIDRLENAETKKSGTFGYLAPELLTGDHASVLSDIYSLGVTFYELATGKPPFEAEDEGALIKLVTETKPQLPSTGDEAIDSLIIRMLEIERENRPSNYLECADSMGEQVTLKSSVKENSGAYLNAGIPPYAEDILRSLRESKRRVSVVEIFNEHEHDLISEAFASLARINFDKTITGEFEALESFTISEENDTKYLQIIDYRYDINQDMKDIIAQLADGRGGKYQILLLTSDAGELSDIKGFEIFSLETMPERFEAYLNFVLKKHSLSEDLENKLAKLCGDDPAIVQAYAEYLIDCDILTFAAEGWREISEFDSCYLPPKLYEICRYELESLSEDKAEFLRWLSIFNAAQNNEAVAAISGADKNNLIECYDKLSHCGLVRFINDTVQIKGDGRRLAYYNTLVPKTRQERHRSACNYFKSLGELQIDDHAFHAFYAGLYKEALELNFKVARKYFADFSLKKARYFSQIAEAAFHELPGNKVINEIGVNLFNFSGEIAKSLAENNKAVAKYSKAARLALALNDEALLAESYKNLADITRLQQKPAESIEYAKKALPIYQSLDDLPHQAACYNNLGLAHWTAGEHDLALENFEQSLAVNEKLGDLTEQSKIYNNIAIINDIKGRKENALAGFNKALECAVKMKNLQLESRYLDNIGYFYLSSGQPQEALEYFRKSYKLAVEIGFDDGQLNVISNIAQAYHKMGDIMKSAEANQKAMEIAESLNHPKFQMQAGYLLARDCLALGNYALCNKMMDIADEIGSNVANPEMLNDLRLLKLEYYLSSGELDRGETLTKSLKNSVELTHHQSVQLNYLQLRYSIALGRDLETIKPLASSIIENNLIEFSGAALVLYADLLLDQGDIGGAHEAIEKYQALSIEDILIEFEHKIVLARFLANKRAYDEALELLADVENKSQESGCLPVFLKALGRHVMILEACGKVSSMKQLIDQIEKLTNTLITSLPDNLTAATFLSSPLLKNAVMVADKYGVKQKTRDGSSQKWKTA